MPEYRKVLASGHNNLGILLTELGNRAEAEEQFRKTLAIREKLVADFPAVPEYRWDLAMSHLNIGNLRSELGKPPEAEKPVRKALAILEKLVAELPAVPRYRQALAGTHRNLGNLLRVMGNLPETEVQLRKALAIQDKLASEFPAAPEYRANLATSHNSLGALLARHGKSAGCGRAVSTRPGDPRATGRRIPGGAEYRVELGGSYCNFGHLIGIGSQPAQSLEWFEKAIRTLTAVYEQDRRLVLARQFLRISHENRALAYDRLRKFTEAINDWDKAIELSPKEEQTRFRTGRATSRLQADQVAEAMAEIAELTKNAASDAGQLYGFACIYSIASSKSADHKQEYADRAMVLLQQAVQAGWNDAAHMAKDTDLDTIRGRDDFKKLVDELAKKMPGKPSPNS